MWRMGDSASLEPFPMPSPGTVYRSMGIGSPWARIGCGVMDKDRIRNDQLDSRMSTWSMIYVLRGAGWYDDDTGRTHALGPGDCFVRLPGITHSTRLDPASRWLEAFIDLGPELWQALAGMQVLASAQPVWHWGLSQERAERFGSLRDDLERAHDRQLPALCLRLLGLALEAQPVPADSASDDAIERACLALTEQATSRVELRAWCRGQGLDYERFRKDFVARMGISPGQYRLRRRMDRACALLQSSQRSLAAISQELGYRSPYEFSAQFRLRMGIAPSRYRALAGRAVAESASVRPPSGHA